MVRSPQCCNHASRTRGGFARSHRLHTTGQGTFIDLRRDGAQLARRRCRRRRQTGKELHRPRRVPAEQLLATVVELIHANHVRHRHLEIDGQVRDEHVVDETPQLVEELVVRHGVEIDRTCCLDALDALVSPRALPAPRIGLELGYGIFGCFHPAAHCGYQSSRYREHPPRWRRRRIVSDVDVLGVDLSSERPLQNRLERHTELFESVRERRLVGWQQDGRARRRDRPSEMAGILHPAPRRKLDLRADRQPGDGARLQQMDLAVGDRPLDVLRRASLAGDLPGQLCQVCHGGLVEYFRNTARLDAALADDPPLTIDAAVYQHIAQSAHRLDHDSLSPVTGLAVNITPAASALMSRCTNTPSGASSPSISAR